MRGDGGVGSLMAGCGGRDKSAPRLAGPTVGVSFLGGAGEGEGAGGGAETGTGTGMVGVGGLFDCECDR
jgi:hypothetical protein